MKYAYAKYQFVLRLPEGRLPSVILLHSSRFEAKYLKTNIQSTERKTINSEHIRATGTERM